MAHGHDEDNNQRKRLNNFIMVEFVVYFSTRNAKGGGKVYGGFGLTAVPSMQYACYSHMAP